jgi:hypothetical protein
MARLQNPVLGFSHARATCNQLNRPFALLCGAGVLCHAVLCCARFEMGQLQERHDHAERDLATVRHNMSTLTAERDHLANQVCVCVCVCVCRH